MAMYADQPHIKKKRVGKACDSCRIKKTKCDGKKPCNRCVADNKLCVFTENKKLREKSYPLGYVELLETRLDLLTRSLEKMVELLTPHVPFLQQLALGLPDLGVLLTDTALLLNYDLSEDDDLPRQEHAVDGQVPINRVVRYLIASEGLLNLLPMEWEEGALIAANFDPNRNLRKSAKRFAEHRAALLKAVPAAAKPKKMEFGMLPGVVLALLALVLALEPVQMLPVVSDVESDNNLVYLGNAQTTVDLLPSLMDPGMGKRLNSLFLNSYAHTAGDLPHHRRGLSSLLQLTQMAAADAAAIVTAPPTVRRLSLNRLGAYSPKIGPQLGVHKPVHFHSNGVHQALANGDIDAVLGPALPLAVAPERLADPHQDIYDMALSQDIPPLDFNPGQGLTVEGLSLDLSPDDGWSFTVGKEGY